MDIADIDALRHNFTVTEDQRHHLLRCWIQSTSCQRCLASDECSWCPFTWSCVPNTHKVQFLAPAHEEQICPAKSEQWELRTQPFGCEVSSTTAVATIVSMTGTLAFVLLMFLTVLAGRRLRAYGLQKQGWRLAWVREWQAEPADAGQEYRPLLQQRAEGGISVLDR